MSVVEVCEERTVKLVMSEKKTVLGGGYQSRTRTPLRLVQFRS